MMSNLKICALLVIAMTSFLLAGCSAVRTPETNPAPKQVQLTQKGGACGSGVGLNEGDMLVLVMDGDSSTGYTWEVGFYVPAVIKPADEQEIQPDSYLTSEGNKNTFRFLAVGEGQAELLMIYKPFEKDLLDPESCQVDVTVW